MAAVRAGEARDVSAIDELVVMLDSDDPAERLAAIRALEAITGETLGYDPASRAGERNAAVARWVDWRRGGDGSKDVPAEDTGGIGAGQGRSSPDRGSGP